MSAIQSDLSGAKYGYDFVVAVTQAAVNSTMLEYLSETTMPEVVMYYNQDSSGNPVLVDRATLLTQTNGTDPFDVASWTSSEATNQGITNLANSSFWYGFKAQIGLPPGYLPADLPDMVTLVSGSQSVIFNLLCSEFQVVAATFGRSGMASYVNTSQPSADAWLFTSNVALQNITDNTNVPATVKTQLNNLGASAFSVQQLLFDLDTATLESTPTISGITAGTPAYTALNEVFLGAYFTAMQTNGQPVLGYSIVPNSVTADPSPLKLSSLAIEVSPYTPASGKSADPDLTTLNYLCASNGDTLPASTAFTWNWIEESEAGSYDGVVAINRNTLAKYFEEQLIGIVKSNCWLPYARVWLTNADTTVNWEYELTNGQTPTITYPATGSTVLTFAYTGPESVSEKSSGFYKAKLSSQYDASVAFSGNTIVITQKLVIYIYANETPSEGDGNVVNTTITDTYSISVNQNGALEIGAPVSQKTDSSQNVKSSMSFVTGLNSILNNISNWAKNLATTNLTDIPVGQLSNFVFPGGNTFTYTDVMFSQNQDLVSHINYADPG